MSDATAAGLLRDIIEHPDDDTPRLVYADWLEEHDQSERAAFIRLQLERARLPATDARAAGLLRREKALLKQHGKAWGETNLGLLGELRRGFIEHVTCSPDQVLMSGAELTERFPVRSLCLRAGVAELSEIRRLAQQPWLGRITALRIALPAAGDCLGSAGLEALLESPYLAGLRVLELPHARIQATGARALAQAGHLTALRELDLTWCLIGPEGMAALAGAAHLAGLTRLVLEATRLGPDGAAALAASPHLRRLRNLDLARTRIQFSGVRELTASGVLATLERLRLGRLGLAVRSAQVLGRCRHLSNLRELDLNSNRLADDGAAALAEGKALAGLRRLLLRRNRITRVGGEALAAATHWAELEHLELSANELTLREQQLARDCFRKGLGVRL